MVLYKVILVQFFPNEMGIIFSIQIPKKRYSTILILFLNIERLVILKSLLASKVSANFFDDFDSTNQYLLLRNSSQT